MNALFTALAGAVLCTALHCAGDTGNFDEATPGLLPDGWIAGVTGAGKPRWTVEKIPAAPSPPAVLKQIGQGDFPWCVYTNSPPLTNGFVQVKFKAVAGTNDQAGGVIWHWQDGGHYYVARANALEDNVTVSAMLQGRRTTLKSFRVKVTPQLWHTLRVDFDGPNIIVSLNGRKVLEADDDKIPGGGAVGVWTKADSVTWFDDFSFGTK